MTRTLMTAKASAGSSITFRRKASNNAILPNIQCPWPVQAAGPTPPHSARPRALSAIITRGACPREAIPAKPTSAGMMIDGRGDSVNSPPSRLWARPQNVARCRNGDRVCGHVPGRPSVGLSGNGSDAQGLSPSPPFLSIQPNCLGLQELFLLVVMVGRRRSRGENHPVSLGGT